MVLSCLAAVAPDAQGSPSPPAAARAALRALTLEAVWRLLLAARSAGGQAQKDAQVAGAQKVTNLRSLHVDDVVELWIL